MQKRALVAAFMMVGCIHQIIQPSRAEVLRRLQEQDTPVFHEHGYEVVARTGHGVLKNDNFTLDHTNKDEYGSATDVCYLLKKEGQFYKGCVYRSPSHPIFNVRPQA